MFCAGLVVQHVIQKIPDQQLLNKLYDVENENAQLKDQLRIAESRLHDVNRKVKHLTAQKGK